MPFRVAVTRTLPELGERLLDEAETRGEIMPCGGPTKPSVSAGVEQTDQRGGWADYAAD